MTPRPLSSFLTRLIWLCMAPLLLIAVWLAWDSLREQEAKHQREGANLAKNFATHIDQFLRARIDALNLLAVSPLADHPRSWPALYAEAQGFRESFGAHVIFADTERRMLFNTRTPYGADLPPLPLSKGRSAAPLALATGKPQVGDLVIGPVSRQPLAAIAVPGLRDGRVAHLMLTTLDAALLQQRLEQAALPQGWSLALQDSTGADIARRSPVGFNAAQDVEADHRFVVPLRQSAWRVVLEIPRASHRDEQQRSLSILAAAIAFATLAGLFGGALASRRVIRAVRTLSEGEEEPTESEFSEVTAAWQRLEQTRIAWRGSEARFRQMFDQTPLPLALVAPDGRILTLNARFQAALGYTPADLPDATVWFERAYPDPALRARALATWTKASQGGDIGPREYRVTTKSGEARDMVISSVLLPEGTLVIFDDVTERRRQESQLRLWAESFEHADFAVAISDASSDTFLAVNPAFARQRGYTPQELIGQPVMSVFPEELRASIRDRLAELVTQPHGVIETEHLTRDGRRFPVLVDMTVIHDDEGRAVNRIAYALDLSERKRVEAELAASQAAALQAREQARIAALNQMEDANAARREAEATAARLRDSEALLRSATDNAAVGLVMLDLNRRYTFANAAYVDILGLPWTAAQLIGMGPAEALAAVYATQISPRLDRAFAGERVSYELTRPRPGPAGDERAHYVVVYDPVQGDTDGVTGVIVTLYDITELKRAEAARRESQERLQLLIDHAPAALAMFDRDMRYLAVSRRWLDDYGLGERDILGLSHYEVFPDIPEAWREVHRRGMAGEVIRADEDHFDRADGSVQWLRWEVRPWQAADGSIGGIVIFAEDITARIQAAHALRDSEARLRATVDTALDCIIAIDANGHVVEFNPAAERTFGFSKAEMVGQALAPRIIPENCRADHDLGLERLRADRDRATMLGRRVELSALRADGSEFPVELAIEMARLEAGPLYVAYLRDISERLQAQQEILELNAGLEQRVAERTAELSAANQELDAFAYAVSHDLRAPLRAMNGFAQALEEDYAGQLQGEAKAYLDQIGLASRRMGDLIEGILTLSRSTRGELRRDEVDISTLARRRLEERARDEPGRQVAVAVEDGLVVKGDSRMLEAALGNLIDNAWKYSAKADTPTIRLHAEERDGRRWFCVEDNGAGFDMAHAARLFQPFQRLHRQDEFPGIGIGLATVARIVHRHGGEIEARGEVGQGATFCFTLADASREHQACAGS